MVPWGKVEPKDWSLAWLTDRASTGTLLAGRATGYPQESEAPETRDRLVQPIAPDRER